MTKVLIAMANLFAGMAFPSRTFQPDFCSPPDLIVEPASLQRDRQVFA
jgi:hypothetical protein